MPNLLCPIGRHPYTFLVALYNYTVDQIDRENLGKSPESPLSPENKRLHHLLHQ